MLIKITKTKLEAEKPADLDKKLLSKLKFMGRKVWTGIFNNNQNLMQEILMTYYARLFQGIEKGKVDDYKIYTFHLIENSKDKIIAEIDVEPKGKDDLFNALFHMTFKEMITKGDDGTIEKKKKKLEQKWFEASQKKGIFNGFRMSAEKVKGFFSNMWNEALDRSLNTLCLRYGLLVEVEE